jgi:3-deoxy-D-manno-octulosonate 8-phosphate phosphatase (KDO 8-P phosphatase)
MSNLEQFITVKAFLFDVDGVFTNNEVQITESGELLRTIHLRDSYAIKVALREGFPIGIITGGTSLGITKRLNELGIEFVATGKFQKSPSLLEFLAKYSLDFKDVLYMGDDFPDIPVLKKVGMPCCPSDAIPEIFPLVNYISTVSGGRGCVRDVIQKTLQIQGRWQIGDL